MTVGCKSQLNIDFFKNLNSGIVASLKISQSEVIGSCVFNSSPLNINNTNFSYKLSFSKEINSAVVPTQTISNLGTGGATNLNWSIQNCDDNKNFKIEPTVIVGDGTITPDISNIIAAVSTPEKNVKLKSSINQATVNFDTVSPSVVINQSNLESIGSCSFTATDTFESVAGFSFKVAFSEKINNSSFTVADVTNSGTGGASTLTWTLVNCGDDQNYKLTASAVSGEGTIIPQILASTVTDLAGNQNTLSTLNGAVTYELGEWKQEAYIKASNTGASNYFGLKISLSEDTLVAGAPQEDSDATTITNGLGFSGTNVSADSGAVFVYKRTGTTWVQEAYIKAVNNKAGRNFGNNISISRDTFAVGVGKEDSDATTITNGPGFSGAETNANTGAVYVYKRAGSNWSQEAYIKASNSETGDNFGASVSISGDTLAVGASEEDSDSITITNGAGQSDTGMLSSSGAVYIYKRSGTNWSQEAYIKPSNSLIYHSFGRYMSISGDTLAVGQPYDNSNATTITNGSIYSGFNTSAQSGAVYIYKRTGSNWAQEAYVKASNSASTDSFGIAVSLSGNSLAVASYYEDSDATTITNGPGFSGSDLSAESGAVYVYKEQALAGRKKLISRQAIIGQGIILALVFH